jgi:hypothetical protein
MKKNIYIIYHSEKHKDIREKREHKSNLEYFQYLYEDTYNIKFIKDTDNTIPYLKDEIIVIGLQSQNFKFQPDYNSNKIISFDRERTDFGKLITDKWFAYLFLKKNNINTIPTSHLAYIKHEPISEKELPVVIKSRTGTNGSSVYLINTPREVFACYKTIMVTNGEEIIDYIKQPFINTSLGSDIRILCMGDKIFSYERNNPNDFRSNIALGANFKRKELNKVQMEGTKNIIQLIRDKFPEYNHLIGIDIFNNDTFQVIELNSNPGLHGPINLFGDEFIQELTHFLKL